MNTAATSSEVIAWMLANEIGDARTIDDAGGSYVAIVLYRTPGGLYEIYLDECYEGTRSDDHYTGAAATDYYLRIVRKRDEGV